MKLLVRLLVLAAAIAVAIKVVPGIHLLPGWGNLLGVALVLGVVNVLIGTVIRVVSLPIRILTVGLFSLVINAVLLEITAHFDTVLTLDNFGAALLAALVISVCTAVFSAVVAVVT